MKSYFSALLCEAVKKYPNTSVLLGLGSAYFTYYLLCVVKKPTLACGPKFRSFLMKNCPIIFSRFWPTVWCFEARAQTVMRSLLKSSPSVPYHKEFLVLSDGGHVALDWLQNNDNSVHPAETRPTILILPGLTGCSQESYALHFARQTVSLGYRCVVFNYRGNGGAELKTPRTYNAANTDDLRSVIESVRGHYPQAPLMAVGISLGGLILTNYLAKHGNESHLVAGMTVSAAWDVFESSKTLEQFINTNLFNRHLTQNLKSNVKRYEHLFKNEFDLDKVYQSQTIREFDDRFTSRQFGYSGYKDYYDDACISRKVHDICVPLLCLNAGDDPFSPAHAIPMTEANNSPYVAIVQTSHGGHIGFLEGLVPRHQSYMDRVFATFVDAVFKNLDFIKDISAN